jgi:hypothetical protein
MDHRQAWQAVDGKERPANVDVKIRSRSRTDTPGPRADDEDRRSARSWLKQRSTSKILGRKIGLIKMQVNQLIEGGDGNLELEILGELELLLKHAVHTTRRIEMYNI